MATKYGTEITFEATATGTGLVYVWKWWDGTVSVTSTNTTTKVVNRWGTLAWTVDVVDELGRAVSTAGAALDVPQPPVFADMALSKNDGVFPYVATLSVEVSGDDYPIECVFNGTSQNVLSPGTISFDALISSAGTLDLSAVDNAGVTTRLPVYVYGRADQAPMVTQPAALPTHQWRTNSSGTLMVLAADPEGQDLTFSWALTSAEGWTPSIGTSPGTSVDVGNGIQNSLVVSTVGQVPGSRLARLTVSDANGNSVDYSVALELLANAAPSIASIAYYPTSPKVGDAVTFSGTSTDPEHDLFTWKWTFGGPIAGPSVQNSRTGIVSTTAPGTIVAMLEVRDRYGASSTLSAPVVSVSALGSPFNAPPYT